MRIATFNAENLFSRVKALNLASSAAISAVLRKIDDFQALLARASYTLADKARLLELHGQLKPYLLVNVERGRLWRTRRTAIVGVAAGGRRDWEGAILLKRAEFSSEQRGMTAKVVRALKADLLCLVETESRQALDDFDTKLLGSRFRFSMLIDSPRDPRGIDLGFLSRAIRIGAIHTHCYDRDAKGFVFSRDCLRLALPLEGGGSLHLLLNHFKSKGYDYDGTATQKRTRQATRLREMLTQSYDLSQDLVVVLGDLNDTPDSAALAPLLGTPNLRDVFDLGAVAAQDRWTYHFEQNEQIDYILVSRALAARFKAVGVERRGMPDLAEHTASGETPFDGVTDWRTAASDHAAIWAEFDLG